MNEKIEDLKSTIATIQDLRFQEKVKLLDFLQEKLKKDLGSLVKEHSIQEAKTQWQKIAQNQDTCNIPTLINLLWDEMCGENGFKYTMKKIDDKFQMKVTYCPLVDLAKKFNATDWGFRFYCMSDYGIVQGFNPEIKFTRTKTLMEGYDFCDHCYSYKKET